MKDVNRCFAEEGIPLTSNHLKMCFISDMYMKIKIKNYTWIGLLSANYEVWQSQVLRRMRINQISYTLLVEVKLMKNTLKNKYFVKVTFSHSKPRISFPRYMFHQMYAYMYQESCTKMSVAALFIIAKTGNNSNTHLQVNVQVVMI